MKNQLISKQLKSVFSILVFYSIAISLRYYIADYKPDFLQNINLYLKVLLLGIGPLIGGVFVVKVLNRPFNLSLFSIGFWKTAIIVLTPIVLFSLVGILDTGKPYLTAPRLVGVIMLYALFEEFGWRGYLQSELSGLKNIYKYLIISVLWFVWHLNFELSIANLIFFIVLLIGSYGIGYMADKSKSLIMTALFHSFFNISQSGLLAGIRLEYKIIIIAISALVAILILRYDNKERRENVA